MAFSADTKMGELLDNPSAKAVLAKFLPDLDKAGPMLNMARGMSLFQVPVRNISWPSNPERWSRKQRRWRGASSRPSSRKCSRREPASGPARLEKEDITFPVEALASIHAGRDRTEDGASCHPL